jgi:hypothetical protein
MFATVSFFEKNKESLTECLLLIQISRERSIQI